VQNRWWNGLSRRQWAILGIAWLGWMFDIADTALFTFAKGPMLTEMLGKDGYKLRGAQVEGTIQMIFLLGWSIGGLIFGVVADRWGRTRALIWTILIYCLFTGLTVFCHTPEQVAVVRFLTALGIGGEWAAGAALVAEVFPDRSRAPAAGLLQSSAALGPALAALASLGLAGSGWRALFLVGVAPALITVGLRTLVKEEETSDSRPVVEAESHPVRALFSSPVTARYAFVALAMGFAGIAGAGAVTFWLPNLVAATCVGHPEWQGPRTSYATLAMHAGTLAGVLIFPMLCDRLGRKPAFALFFLASPLSILLATHIAAAASFGSLLLAAPIMSFFSIGVSSGFGLYFPELFPTAVRATGCGFAYNVGRVLTAPIPKWTGDYIKAQHNNAAAGVMAAGMVYVVGLLALPFAPETRGQKLKRMVAVD